MKIPAIPTKYAGVQFRSRLEARWAAFFDLIGWRWDYEPVDLAGYIPDFVVETHYLVEVKPITWWPCPVTGCVDCSAAPRVDYDEAISKIENSGWLGRFAVLVGAVPFKCKSNGLSLGRIVLSELYMPGDGFAFECGDPVGVWREAGNRVQWSAPR